MLYADTPMRALEEKEVVNVSLIIGPCIQVSKKNKSKIIGYCCCNTHKGFLTRALMKNHECMKKRCTFFRRIDDSPYWVNYVEEQEKRAAGKKLAAELQERDNKLFAKMKEDAQKIVEEMRYPIIVTRVAEEKDTGSYIINYVTDRKRDSYYDYFSLAILMKQIYGGKFFIRRMKNIEGRFVTVAEWERISSSKK